jgi:pimeloyl-ACP methyl ester carboxylesterase
MSSSTSATSGFAEVNGARLYYEVAGEGRPLALLHFGLGDTRFWDDQFDVFARRYRVIRFDARGFGRSPATSTPFSRHEDLYGLLRFLGVVRAALVGVSMGGGTAIEFTLAHPEMVGALIPVGAGLGGFDMEPTPVELALFEQAEAAAKAGDIATANELEVHIWVDGPNRTPDQVDPAVRERVREMNRLTFNGRDDDEDEDGTERRLDPPAAGRLSEILAPTLVIIGDQDVSVIQSIADHLAAQIPGAHKAVMHDTAHAPNMEKPDEFNRLVLEFLDSVYR